jgi:hypothetical protein
MDIRFLFYIFLSIVFILGGSYRYYGGGQGTAAALFFLGSFSAAVFFGLRWFSASGEVNTGPAGKWPPVIKYCPDYLTLTTYNKKAVCVDTLGIASGGTANIVKVSSLTPSADNQTFDLYTSLAGDQRLSALYDECQKKGVKWEGVWNGTTGQGNLPPLPPSI